MDPNVLIKPCVRLNLSFVKDVQTYGKKVARNGRTIVIYKGHSFRIRVYLAVLYSRLTVQRKYLWLKFLSNHEK